MRPYPQPDLKAGKIECLSTDRLHLLIDGLLDLRLYSDTPTEYDEELKLLAAELRRRTTRETTHG